MTNTVDHAELERFYGEAKRWLLSSGCGEEIAWQESVHPADCTETTFLSEAAWVVYNSGFREAVVRRQFDFLSLCFCDWSSAQEIVEAGSRCVEAAMLAIRNRRKHEAVVGIAARVAEAGFDAFKQELLSDPLNLLQSLPFIGPITSIHLAKNLGFSFAKPDRHLVRLQKRLGLSDVHGMCSHLASVTGDPVPVIDLVLWRFLERRAAKDSVPGQCAKAVGRRDTASTKREPSVAARAREQWSKVAWRKDMDQVWGPRVGHRRATRKPFRHTDYWSEAQFEA